MKAPITVLRSLRVISYFNCYIISIFFLYQIMSEIEFSLYEWISVKCGKYTRINCDNSKKVFSLL